jgi:predicted secreted protein
MTDPQVFEVSGRPGEPITLPVGSTAATGHSWQLELPEGVELLGEVPGPPPAPDAQAGAPTGSRLQVRAPAGRYEITARLARPWETEPVRVVRIVVAVS